MMNERSPCGVGMWWGGGSRGEQGAKDCQRACCVGARCALPVGSEVIVILFFTFGVPFSYARAQTRTLQGGSQG